MSDSDQGYAWEARFIPYTKGIIRQLNVSLSFVGSFAGGDSLERWT